MASFLFARQRGKQLFADRPSLSDEEIYRQYFGESGLSQALVIELWHEVGKVLRLPPDKLRPTDRFGEELGGYWITSEGLDELAAVATARASQREAKLDLEDVKTLDEYIRRLAVLIG